MLLPRTVISRAVIGHTQPVLLPPHVVLVAQFVTRLPTFSPPMAAPMVGLPFCLLPLPAAVMLRGSSRGSVLGMIVVPARAGVVMVKVGG